MIFLSPISSNCQLPKFIKISLAILHESVVISYIYNDNKTLLSLNQCILQMSHSYISQESKLPNKNDKKLQQFLRPSILYHEKIKSNDNKIVLSLHQDILRIVYKSTKVDYVLLAPLLFLFCLQDIIVQLIACFDQVVYFFYLCIALE